MFKCAYYLCNFQITVMSFVEALRLAIESSHKSAQLEYAWYEPWTLALNLFLPTLIASHGKGHSSITLSPQYWLFPLMAPPNHSGYLRPDFVHFYTSHSTNNRD
jgi:hypothetical protein